MAVFRGRGWPGLHRFPSLAAIGMLKATVEHKGHTTVARRYVLSARGHCAVTPLVQGYMAQSLRLRRGTDHEGHPAGALCGAAGARVG